MEMPTRAAGVATILDVPDSDIHEQTHAPDQARSLVRRAARRLGLATREFVSESSRAKNLHDVDVHAVGVLLAARHEGREVTAGDLADELALSRAATSALIDRMVRSGHVERRRSAADGRRVVLSPTDDAATTSDELFDPLVAAYDEVLRGYTPDQVALVAQVLDRLADRTRATSPGRPR